MINNEVRSATKWSLLTELMAKIIVPVTNILLAHILSPVAFGVVATITMITSFAEMLADAGFQKFLVQHEFSDDKEKKKYINVAFTVNLILVLLILFVIILERNRLAGWVGSPGMGNALALMALALPFTAFSSIQMAMYRRSFNFKFLMKVRLVTICTPIFISIPLALWGFDYWALIIGTILSQALTSLVIFVWGTESVSLKFNTKIFRDMFGFSAWSLLEAFSIWMTVWADTFIIGNAFDSYHLGVYKTPAALVNSAMSLVTASVVPVLYAALSRLQNNPKEFEQTFFTFQKYMAMIVIPLGVGLFVFKDIVTYIVFGDKWADAGIVLGSWALSSAIMAVTANLVSEVFRAKGYPVLSFWSQILHLIVLVPAIIISIRWGFDFVVYIRSIIRSELLLVEMIFLYLFIHINPLKLFSNIGRYLFSSAIMGMIGYCFVLTYPNVMGNIVAILACIISYFVILSVWKEERRVMHTVYNEIVEKIERGK